MTAPSGVGLGAVAADIPADPLDILPADARIAVAMSGGVDSSVAAARCAARASDVVGITLAMWPRDREQDRDRGCCSVDAVDDARRVAARLGIPHYAWNLEAAFQNLVIANYAEEYVAGRTPNPCVACNRAVKFGVLLERARAIGATHVATGHWAQLGRRGETFSLHRARNRAKDQSYTLSRLDQSQLSAAVFPLGAVGDKSEIRDEARALGLVTAAKPDSQELCFVSGTVDEDLRQRLHGRFTPGEIVNRSGDVVGEHRGIPFYTVGQRSGLGIAPSRPDAAPLHVLDIDVAANRVVVGERSELARRRVAVRDWTWVGDRPPVAGAAVRAQLRAHGRPADARLAGGGTGVELVFDPPVFQVAPGQVVVLYDGDGGDEVLGSGIVERAVA